jgi:hypothetical protein
MLHKLGPIKVTEKVTISSGKFVQISPGIPDFTLLSELQISPFKVA